MSGNNDIRLLMDRVVKRFSSVDGIRAIFIIDFESMETQYDTFEHEKPTKEKLDLIKNSVKLFKNKDVEVAYIEEKEKLFIKRIQGENIVIAVVTATESRMGNIFSLLKLI